MTYNGWLGGPPTKLDFLTSKHASRLEQDNRLQCYIICTIVSVDSTRDRQSGQQFQWSMYFVLAGQSSSRVRPAQSNLTPGNNVYLLRCKAHMMRSYEEKPHVHYSVTGWEFRLRIVDDPNKLPVQSGVAGNPYVQFFCNRCHTLFSRFP